MKNKEDRVQMRMSADIKKDMYQASFNEGITLTSWLTRLARIEIQNQKARLGDNFYNSGNDNNNIIGSDT